MNGEFNRPPSPVSSIDPMASYVASSTHTHSKSFIIDFSQAFNDLPHRWNLRSVWTAATSTGGLSSDAVDRTFNLPPQTLMVQRRDPAYVAEQLMVLATCQEPSLCQLVLRFGDNPEDVRHEALLYEKLLPLQGHEVPISYGLLTGKDRDGKFQYCLVLHKLDGDPVGQGEDLTWYADLELDDR